MCQRTTAWAWALKNISPIEKLTLLALVRFYDEEEDMCTPSIEQIVKITGLSKSSVKKSISFLIERGLIWKDNQFASDGANLPNSYTFLLFQS